MFKAGQTVWCILRGKGRVLSVKDSGPEWQQGPVVRFPIGHVEGLTTQDIRYTLDGKTHAYAVNRALWFSEPKIVAEAAPKWERMFAVGQKVVVMGPSWTAPAICHVNGEDQGSVLLAGHGWVEKSKNKFYELGKEISYN